MKISKTTTAMVILFSLAVLGPICSQELSVSKSANVKNFPEYVIITSRNTKLLGGIGITIDSKNSKYQDQLENLDELLSSKHGLRIRNQTDLLNAMSDLGFDYINVYNASAIMPPSDSDAVDDLLNIVE
ncbi:MAG: hypothetical protein COA50_03500 [Flavobacteriaceae bacterium]|nr:MAG: hypothetical protein COA50_03500 [Flavobacteriaceae bacterium]